MTSHFDVRPYEFPPRLRAPGSSAAAFVRALPLDDLPFGTMRVPEAMKSIELFATEVLPHLRDDSGVLAPPENGSTAGRADGAAVSVPTCN